jgi:glycosyltransferase involved in cell wall biosynthesis
MLSVVIPTRNRAEKLRVCLHALLTQDYPSEGYEIVVVDDGSTDGTRALVERLAADGTRARLRYAHQSHRGSNAARNLGIMLATGDPVALIDDDTEPPSTWLRSLTEGMARHPAAVAFGGPVRLRLEGPAPRSCGREARPGELDLGTSDREIPFVLGANMALRRQALALAGSFDERLVIGGAETEWLRRLQDRGRVVYLADAGLWHRRTAEDMLLRNLVRARFVRASHFHAYFALASRRTTVGSALRPVPAMLRHAVVERCAEGLLEAVTQLGYAYGIARWGRWGRQRGYRP